MIKDTLRRSFWLLFCRLLQRFASMQAGLTLLLLLAILSGYGSLMPHAEALEKVYRSWWFGFVFFLTALNLLFCSLRRIHVLLKMSRAHKEWEKSMFSANAANAQAEGPGGSEPPQPDYHPYQFLAGVQFAGNRDTGRQNMAAWLNSRHYRLRVLQSPPGEALLAEKGRWGHYGTLITHLSLIFMLATAYVGGLTGSEEFVRGFPGEMAPVQIKGEPFLLEICDFYIDYRDDGSINQYYSELTLRPATRATDAAGDGSGGDPVASETIYVNRPLRYGGKVFYQSGYGWGLITNFFHPPSGSREQVLLIPGQEHFFAPAGLTVQMLDFYPELDRDERGHLYSRSPQPRSPYVLFRLLDREGRPAGPSALLRGLGQPMELPVCQLTFTAHHNYTGILVSENPGKFFLLTGSLLFLTGLFISFYIRPQRLLFLRAHTVSAPPADPPEVPKAVNIVWIYGWSKYGGTVFTSELEEIVKIFQREGGKRL